MEMTLDQTKDIITLDLCQKQISDLDERIKAVKDYIQEIEQEKANVINDYVDFRNKYIKYKDEYSYVKGQFPHFNVCSENPCLMTTGIGFSTASILKISNISFKFSDSFSIYIDIKDVDQVEEITKEEFEEELYEQLEKIKNYAIYWRT